MIFDSMHTLWYPRNITLYQKLSHLPQFIQIMKIICRIREDTLAYFFTILLFFLVFTMYKFWHGGLNSFFYSN